MRQLIRWRQINVVPAGMPEGDCGFRSILNRAAARLFVRDKQGAGDSGRLR